ncbi:BglG family transcription antiterminator [Bacillus sp. 03113]|uniref:BglG family transcription antiterminator n=1 Tax=Bacillus sp. 03113 TaxID=2578211 RepID=UPI0011411673|nr:BglG family transcription antiterminator [Bacillus sp. 03113]
MMVSARERQIIHFLTTHIGKEATVKEIAAQIGVSERTIHRDLNNIEDFLKKFHLQLVKKSGFGLKIMGNASEFIQLNRSILTDSPEYTPNERLMIILSTLLDQQEPVKLLTLADDLGVTIATVSHDLDKLESYLHQLNLILIRRRGYGIELYGSEESKRKAIRKLIADRFDVPEFLKVVQEYIQKRSLDQTDVISKRLLNLIHHEKLLNIEKIVGQINERLPYPLADSSYVGLVVHLALLIERIQRGQFLKVEDELLSQLRLLKEFSFAKEVGEKLQETFQLMIPDEEIGYITMHLSGAKIRFETELGFFEENVETSIIAQQLIENVEKLANISLKQDISLFQGLKAHLQPALFRIKQNMRITNPLLLNIKKDYIELYQFVKKAVELTLPNIDVPDEEIGYLVLHFGSSINMQPLTKKLKVLIICSSGIGTSKMLAAKIKQHIPKAEIKNVSVFDLKNISLDLFDFILSTIPIEGMEREYLLVSPILIDEELEKLKSYFQVKGETFIGTHKEEEEGQAAIEYEDFKTFTIQSKLIIELLDSLDFYQMGRGESVESVLYAVSQKLFEKKMIGSINGSVDALLRREKLGGLGIPGTRLALFHARNAYVCKPVFNVIDLEAPMMIKSMDDQTIEVERILLMLAPEEKNSHVLEVLSFISSLIIQNQQSMHIFEKAYQKRLTQFITEQFAHHFSYKN